MSGSPSDPSRTLSVFSVSPVLLTSASPLGFGKGFLTSFFFFGFPSSLPKKTRSKTVPLQTQGEGFEPTWESEGVFLVVVRER